MPVYDETNIEDLQSRLLDTESQDLELDLGCGKSNLCHSLAGANPSVQYVGVDWNRHFCMEGERGRRKYGISNVFFVNLEAGLFLKKYVRSASVRAVYIFFPSPAPRAQRLVTESFLWEVFRVLSVRGELRLITDDSDYYSSIRKSLRIVGWEEDFWVPFPFILPPGLLVGTPCEEEYGSHFVLCLRKRY